MNPKTIPLGLPQLQHLFGGYFHQDWDDEYLTAQKAVADFVAHSSTQEVSDTLTELEQLIKWVHEEQLDQESISELLLGQLGCYYYPPGIGLSYDDWFVELKTELSASLPSFQHSA